MQTALSNPDRVDPEDGEPDVEATEPEHSPAATGSIDDRLSNRVPLERQIELSFADFDGFVTECSMNISATGMFIRCDDPQPAGSVLDFSFALTDGDKLIRGYGEVMWARRRDDGPERPAGMGIRFLHLDAESRELIRWTVTRRYITGAGPCDIDEVKSAMRRAAEREAAERAEAPTPGVANEAGPQAPRPARARLPRGLYREAGYAAAASQPTLAQKLRPVAAVTALMLGGLYLLQLTSTSIGASPTPPPARSQATEDAGTRPAAAEATEIAVQPAVPAEVAKPAVEVVAEVSEPAGAEVATAPASTGVASAELTGARPPEEAVKEWARAWSRQRPDDYLAAYAADFRLPRGQSRDRWEAQRRTRILKPRWIQLEIGALVTEVEDGGRARVSFDQSYRSDTYHDIVRKTLLMVRDDAGWKILEEQAES